MGLFEVNEAAAVVHDVAHPDANIIFGAVVDDSIGAELKVTVIAAGFDRWEEGATPRSANEGGAERVRRSRPAVDVFATEEEDPAAGDDEFEVPSFLK